ncbi:hypothetical protein GCM10029964_038330 [Kibdelosporangium lantanae]
MAAMTDADVAAHRAGVVIRELTELAAFDEVYRLFDEIWRPDPTNPPITVELMRAFSKAGNYVTGAYDGSRLVGACVGFFAEPAGTTLHSHVTGVALAGRNIGYAIKLHQREWAVRRGLTAISWTYDPLVSRNAYFNLVKLGAVPTEYLVDFYGTMNDRVNLDDESDRLLVRWDLSPTATDGLGRSSEPTVRVAVPDDIERIRTTDPDRAREWRLSVRTELGGSMARGAKVVGFDHGYLLSTAPGRAGGSLAGR